MKKIWFILFLIVAGSIFGQSKLKVLSAGDLLPISNASVYCNGKLLARTNAEGIAFFRSNCRAVDVRAKGYYEDEVVVDKVMEITLAKEEHRSGSIEKITLNDKNDERAIAILNMVNDRYADNSPISLDSYSFKSYERISFDLDEDTVTAYRDFLEKRLDSLNSERVKIQDSEKIKDSVEATRVQKLARESKMFLWERAQNFSFSKKYGEKITVLDNRMAGLKEPMYEMLTLKSNRVKIPKEIDRENRNLYRYYLTDTIDIEGRKNYVIRFREVSYRQSINRRKYNGYIYIDVDTYAVKKIESNSRNKYEGSITSIWIPLENKWFLQKEMMKSRAGSMAFKQGGDEDKKNRKKFGYYVYRTADYFDYKVNFEANPNDFRGYTMEVKNADGKLLDEYRTYALTSRDRDTYKKIDSVGSKYKLDQKAKIFSSLLGGYLRVGKVNFDVGRLFGYNLYEGFRLGLGAKLNDRFNKYISPDAYFGYGFKDGSFKYGFGVDFKTSLEKNSFFRVEYYDDVLAAGRFNENLWSFRMKYMNSGIDLNNDRFFGYKGMKLSYENDILNSLTMRIAAFKNQERSLFDYNYKNRGNHLENFATKLTIKYAPKSKNIMTPTGKFTFEENFPDYYFNFEQAFNTLGGNLSYSKFDVMANHVFKSKAGVTGIRTYAGLLLGDAPIWHHFQSNGLAGTDGLNFNLTSYLGFATMNGGQYYTDKFFGYYFSHRIPWHFKSFGQTTSSFDVIYRGIIGNMKNPQYHQFNFDVLNKLYQETGIEWNNFLSTNFNLGFFYRVGPYQTRNFKENFAIQLKLKVLGF